MPYYSRREYKSLPELLERTAASKILEVLPASTQKEIADRTGLSREYVSFLLNELMRWGEVVKTDKYRRKNDQGPLTNPHTSIVEGKLLFPSYWVDHRVYPILIDALRKGQTLDYVTARSVLSELERTERIQVLKENRAKCRVVTQFGSDPEPVDKQLRDLLVQILWRTCLPIIITAAFPRELPQKKTKKSRLTLSFTVEYSIEDDLDAYLLLRNAHDILEDFEGNIMEIHDKDEEDISEQVSEQIEKQYKDYEPMVAPERLKKAKDLVDGIQSKNSWVEFWPNSSEI